jgi:hypothetical protein
VFAAPTTVPSFVAILGEDAVHTVRAAEGSDIKPVSRMVPQRIFLNGEVGREYR